jgi:asparagine synthase (glutamine-hydrolysing)
MSVQYGIWHFDGETLDPENFVEVQVLLAPYAPDDISVHAEPTIGLLYGALHTTLESRRETQPYVSASGAIFLWDGRLDNGPALLRELGESCGDPVSEVQVVAACYRRWGLARLGALVGDWALTVWDPNNRSLVLAKDFAGTRQLYYRIEKGKISWSTVLDPLVRMSREALSLCGEYLAGCLSFLPAAHLTPYTEIFSVPPSCYLFMQDGSATTKKHWDFNPGKVIRYRTDAEYEAHFLDVFRQSVGRRLRSDQPVLAELSGGMDSSSIVCVADDLLASRNPVIPRLDTISYFSNSEPDWDELPYFVKVEERRSRTGFHVDMGDCGFFRFGFASDPLTLTPGAGPRTDPERQIAEIMRSSGHRVLLSGIGGDELMGGVPTPIPELSDLVAAGEFSCLAHQLKVWALAQRKPWVHLFADMCRDFLPIDLGGTQQFQNPAHWICDGFARRHRNALLGYPNRIRLFGSRPSFQHGIGTIHGLRRSLSWSSLSPDRQCEIRYPYLDRCLVEFLFAIPRDQLVRPGQRRSLMRRALRGIVPVEIICRRRKAFVARAPRTAIAAEWNSLANAEPFVAASLGIVNSVPLLEAMDNARLGREVPLVPLVRTIALECWLRHLFSHKISSHLALEELTQPLSPARPAPKEKGGETHEIREARSCRIG